MAGDVDLDIQKVADNTTRLLTLADLVQQLQHHVATMRENQTSDVWPHVQGVREFAAQYRSAILRAESELVQIQGAIDEARLALAASARSHELQDHLVQQRLATLAGQLDAGLQAPAESAHQRSLR